MRDALLLEVVDDIDTWMSRRKYEEFLVKEGHYTLATLKDDEQILGLTKRDLILDTLRDDR